MASINGKNGAHRKAISRGDILGGPDPGGREDIISTQGKEPMPGTDILGGPDGVDRGDVVSAPGRPVGQPSDDVLGGPDSPDEGDIMSPPDTLAS
jgi:hypothetical protein